MSAKSKNNLGRSLVKDRFGGRNKKGKETFVSFLKYVYVSNAFDMQLAMSVGISLSQINICCRDIRPSWTMATTGRGLICVPLPSSLVLMTF